MAVRQLSDGGADGVSLGQSATEKVSLYGAAPVVQPTAAAQAAITDNSGGTAAPTTGVSANLPKYTLVLPLGQLSGLISGTRKLAIPHAFTVTAINVRTGNPATTAAKAVTLTTQIAGTPTTGGVAALTSANMTPSGALVAGSAITAANVGTAGQTLEVALSAVTAFVEGDGWVEFTITNNEISNTVATILGWTNAARTALVNLGVIKGS